MAVRIWTPSGIVERPDNYLPQPQQQEEPLNPLSRLAFLRMCRKRFGLRPDDIRVLIVEHVTDPAAREDALEEFNEAREFDPSHPLLRLLAQARGVTAAQFDAAWRAVS